MDDKELKQLKILFQKNKNNVASIRSEALIESVDKILWSKSPSYSLAPFEIECNGYKLGKTFSVEPDQKAGIIEYGFNNNKIAYIYNYGPKGTPNSIKYFLWDKQKVETYLFVKGYNDKPKTLTTVAFFILNDLKLPIIELSYFQDYYDEDDEDDSPSSYDIIKKTFLYGNNEQVNKIEVRGFIEKRNTKIERDTDYIIYYNGKGELDHILGTQNSLNNKQVQVYPK